MLRARVTAASDFHELLDHGDQRDARPERVLCDLLARTHEFLARRHCTTAERRVTCVAHLYVAHAASNSAFARSLTCTRAHPQHGTLNGRGRGPPPHARTRGLPRNAVVRPTSFAVTTSDVSC